MWSQDTVLKHVAAGALVLGTVACTTPPRQQSSDSVLVAVNPADDDGNRMLDQVLPIAVGFVLTTLVGGMIGHHLQNRSWRFQRRETLRELHQAEATKVFDEVSRVLDRRNYRMSLVRWALEREPLDWPLVENQWKLYRRVVFSWNDTVNRNRALIRRYFGEGASQKFELGIGEGFVYLGRLLEQCYRERRGLRVDEKAAAASMSEQLTDAIWRFDDALVQQITDGRVGAFCERESPVP